MPEIPPTNDRECQPVHCTGNFHQSRSSLHSSPLQYRAGYHGRDGHDFRCHFGVDVAEAVYVHPSFHAAEIERERKRAERTEERLKEERLKEERLKEERLKEEEKETNVTTNVATAVDEKAEGHAEEFSAAAHDIPEGGQTADTTEQ
ncbi:hypothetical protein AYO20_11506 [Fonsecaea nubica]|uniref:Uncharacterized protein n=1 Tax=Fonsecaea nubica TaxID=856822 RepID=A0A178BTX5_9EURO|nr:hypothetical protein AYO20_11506 [Fonsecaea nubica]OAL20355.1 hypothetical protein AYO20_11506 [Fonsecaea nubica]